MLVMERDTHHDTGRYLIYLCGQPGEGRHGLKQDLSLQYENQWILGGIIESVREANVDYKVKIERIEVEASNIIRLAISI